MVGQRSRSVRTPAETWIGLGLCAAVALGWALGRRVPDPDGGQALGPVWLPLVAAGIAAAGILPLGRSAWRLRLQPALCWIGVLLLLWAANGLPFDLLTMAGLIGHQTANGDVVMSTVYWPGLVTRAAALAAAVMLARAALARPAPSEPAHPAPWYGYAAFVLALPYPLMRVHWAMGGTLGISAPGRAGEGWEPLLIAVPWVLAAGLSLLLVSPPTGIPRRLLLTAGWAATVIVAMIGPAALWALISAIASGGDTGSEDIALWVFALLYGSWFLWAIAAAAATRSYQLRTAPGALQDTQACAG